MSPSIANLKISSRIAMLNVGMYIFRYASLRSDPLRGCISLHHSPIGKGSVDFFPGEGISRNTLTKQGDCVIVRVKGSQASVLITEYHPEGGTPNSVQLQIEQIGTAAKTEPRQHAGKAVQLEAFEAPRPCSLKLLGHIETRGDVTVENTWLGNPNSLLRLEGFSIAWDNQPQGLDLAYLCRSSKGGEPQVGLAGQYVGTRRQAKPVTAVAFTLSGPQAGNYELSGEVVFAGHSPLAIAPDKELSGKSGTEQLVAIRIVITPRAAQASPPASPWDDLKTTKIFSNR